MHITIPLILALCLATNNVHGQNQMVFEAPDPKADSIWSSERDAYCTARIGKPFPLIAEAQTVDGKNFDFGRLTHTTVVCLGFYGCHPCMRELPGFVRAAKDHPDIDFVYITFDAEKERKLEFSGAGLANFKPTPNYHIIHLDRAKIDRLKLASGYPTKYVLDKNGMVTNMMFSFPNIGRPLAEQIHEFIFRH